MTPTVKLPSLPDDKPGLIRTWGAVWLFLFVTWSAFLAAVAVVYFALRWAW